MQAQQAFFQAIQAGDQESVSAQLAGEPSLRAAHNAGGTSAILWAIYTGQDAMARFLVAQGAEVTLYEAAALGLTEQLAPLLVANPQGVNLHATDGFTALGLAAFFGQAGAVELLLAHGAQPSLASTNAQHVAPLHSAVAHQHEAIARMLIVQGADVDARQESGVTPLHEAAHHGSVALVSLLLDASATINQRNDQGVTALQYAQENGDRETIALLTQRGATL
jgi:uncharacterized protein